MAEETIGRGVIEFEADTSGLSASMEAAAQSVERFENKAVDAAQGVGAAMGQTGIATEKLDATTKRFLNSLERESMQAGRSRSEYLELRAAKLGVADASAPLIARLRAEEQAAEKAGIAFNKYGLSAKQTQAALRQVPAQLTDIFVSLQGGQNPLTVLLQQGGQLRDVFGGAMPAVKALGGALVGLINPYTILIASAAALAAGFAKGEQEAFNLSKALVMSGNAAGTTTDQLMTMAEAIDATVGTQAKAAETLAALAATGRVAGGDLQRFGEIAIRMERVTGQAVSETVKQFAELGKSPAEAARRLNETTRFLTSSIYEQIRALEEQGRVVDAARVAQEAYASSAETRLAQLEGQLGILPRLWQNIADAAKEAWDAILNVGRPQTSTSMIAGLQSQLAALEASTGLAPEFGGVSAGAAAPQIQALRDQIELLQTGERESKRYADADRKRNQEAESAIKAQDEIERIRKESATNQEKLNKALGDYRRNIEAIRKADPTSALLDPARIAKDEANIRERFKERGRKPKDETEQIRKAMLAEEQAAVKRALDSITGNYRNAESILESVRSAGLVSEKEYYEAKRGFVRLTEAEQLRALDAQIASWQKEKVTGAERIQLDTKIADAKAKRAEIEAGATTQIVLLNARESASLEQLASAYQSARIAAEQFLAQQSLRQNRSLDLMNMGPRAREREEGRNQIIDTYGSQRQALEAQKAMLEFEKKFDSQAQEQYNKRFSLINEFQAKALSSYDAYYDELRKREADWTNGAADAVRTYQDEAMNTAKMVGEFYTNTYQQMEDALVKFVTTGKLDFKSLADSILADITRIIIKQQVMGPLMQFLGLGGGTGGLGGGLLSMLFGGPSQFGMSSASSGFFNNGVRLATGTNYVPHDNFPALLHKGEAVVPARYNPAAGGTSVNRSSLNNITINVPPGTSRPTAEQIAVSVGREMRRSAGRGGS